MNALTFGIRFMVSIAILFALAGISLSQTAQPPTWRGLECLGWTETESHSLADGESEGEELVVNTELTPAEKHRLFLSRQAAEATYKAESELEKEIIASHGYSVDDRFSRGSCGEYIGIRVDEYHITQFVPSNPKYPGDSSKMFLFMSSNTPFYCREYFMKLRKHAVKATYGAKETE